MSFQEYQHGPFIYFQERECESVSSSWSKGRTGPLVCHDRSWSKCHLPTFWIVPSGSLNKIINVMERGYTFSCLVNFILCFPYEHYTKSFPFWGHKKWNTMWIFFFVCQCKTGPSEVCYYTFFIVAFYLLLQT